MKALPKYKPLVVVTDSYRLSLSNEKERKLNGTVFFFELSLVLYRLLFKTDA